MKTKSSLIAHIAGTIPCVILITGILSFNIKAAAACAAIAATLFFGTLALSSIAREKHNA